MSYFLRPTFSSPARWGDSADSSTARGAGPADSSPSRGVIILRKLPANAALPRHLIMNMHTVNKQSCTSLVYETPCCLVTFHVKGADYIRQLRYEPTMSIEVIRYDQSHCNGLEVRTHYGCRKPCENESTELRKKGNAMQRNRANMQKRCRAIMSMEVVQLRTETPRKWCKKRGGVAEKRRD